jgi:hypothetical protein
MSSLNYTLESGLILSRHNYNIRFSRVVSQVSQEYIKKKNLAALQNNTMFYLNALSLLRADKITDENRTKPVPARIPVGNPMKLRTVK